MEENKLRYSDEELEEFRILIEQKLAVAKSDYEVLIEKINGAPDDEPHSTYQTLEEGSETLSKESLMGECMRAQKFITGLQAALVRIKNKTYGICRETGNLIPKERLRAVPHATLSIEAKQARDKRH